MKPIKIQTKRLVLRRANDKDTLPLFQCYFSDDSRSKFLTRKSHIDLNQTKNFLKKWCDIPWDIDRDQFAWVIALASTNKAIGIFLVELENHKAQIHYGIASDFSRRGLIVEAGNAVIKWLMNQESLESIWAICDLENESSTRVLEKLNFRYSGIFKDKIYFPAFEEMRDCGFYILST